MMNRLLAALFAMAGVVLLAPLPGRRAVYRGLDHDADAGRPAGHLRHFHFPHAHPVSAPRGVRGEDDARF